MRHIENDVIPALKDLHNISYRDFQDGLRDYLFSIGNSEYSDDFFYILNYFRSEFIVSSYLYIEHINHFLSIFLNRGKFAIDGLLSDIIFIASIGNSFTRDILREYLLHFTGRDNILLGEAIASLEKRLLRIEDGIESLIFHPAMGIEDSWE